MSQIKIGLIGGTGLGEGLVAALGSAVDTKRHEIDTPFGKPSDTIVEINIAGLSVFILPRHGPGHLLNPSQVPYRANIYAMKSLGVTHILASGAVGSLRDEFKPRDLVIPNQIIDKTTRRAGTFFENAAVHVEFSEPFCPVLRQMLMDANQAQSMTHPDASGTNAQADDAKVHDGGCYVCMEGPAFSTRAESLMHRLWGGDLIGMTVMPEAKLAREAEISYALIALVTDYDCWKHSPAVYKSGADDSHKSDPFALLNEILAHVKFATARAIALMKSTIEEISRRQEELIHCPASHALQLGIWSDKSKIDPAERQKLDIIWGRYFNANPS